MQNIERINIDMRLAFPVAIATDSDALVLKSLDAKITRLPVPRSPFSKFSPVKLESLDQQLHMSVPAVCC